MQSQRPSLNPSLAGNAGKADARWSLAMSLLSDLQDQLEATSQLLDRTTNGFCIVDSSNGNIVSASAQLSETLGSSQLLGACLSDFVDHNDKVSLE